MVRNTSYRRGTVSLAGQLFIALLTQRDRLAFPKAVAQELWAMIDASTDEEAMAFKYATSVLVDRLRAKEHDETAMLLLVDRYFSAWMVPDLIVAAVDELVAREEVSETTAAQLRRQIELWTTPTGEWRW